jgi:hypothetical protein
MGKPQQCIAQTPGSLLSRLNSQVVTISFDMASMVIVFDPNGERSNHVRDTVWGHGAFPRAVAAS